MSLQIVRFTAAQDRVRRTEKGIERLFAAVHAAAPEDIRYLAARTAEGTDFMLMLHLADGAANPLPTIPEAAAFRQEMPQWAVTPPAPEPMIVLGDYRLLA
jgi:hypothetical protein